MNIYKRYTPDTGELSEVAPDDSGVLLRTIIDSSPFEMTECSLLAVTDDFIIEFEIDDTLLESERQIIDNKQLIRATIDKGIIWPL